MAERGLNSADAPSCAVHSAHRRFAPPSEERRILWPVKDEKYGRFDLWVLKAYIDISAILRYSGNRLLRQV
jgi:hypothetical protein